MAKNKNVVLGTCSLELVSYTTSSGRVNKLCVLVLPNGEQTIIGFTRDYKKIIDKIKR